MIKLGTSLTGILAACAFLVLPPGCGDTSGPSPVTALNGWVVGDADSGYGTILHTVDGGTTWIRQGDASTVPDVFLGSVRAVDSLQAWVVGPAADGYGTILRTSDAGETWSRIPASAGIPAVGFLDLCILDGNTIWVAGSNNTILYTNDGGNTWTSMSDPAFDEYAMVSISALNNSDIWVCGSNSVDGLIIHSTDGGATWTVEGDSTLLIDYPLISISAFDQDHAWVVGHGYTFANTTDGGTTWNLCVPDSLNRTPGSDDANGVCPTGVNRAWVAVDYGGIYLTEDGGDSWTKQSVSPEAGGFYLVRTCATDQSTAWTVGLGVGDGIILHTTDGTTWSTQSTPVSVIFSDVSFVDSFH